jgi:hypothetical protein
VPPTLPLIGVIGKTNVGKSTFFEAATLVPAKIENRPFVTIEPNIGIGYVRKQCPHTQIGLPKCNPQNSLCINGFRFIPVKLMDVAGLVRGAHRGRGLGNKFLDDLRQADVLLHVVDMAGSTNEEGMPVKPGTYDPLNDIIAIEFEINEWFYNIILKDWEKFSRSLDVVPWDQVVDLLAKRVSGLSIRREHVIIALKEAGLENTKPGTWDTNDLKLFTKKLREVSKPIIVVANKMDIPEAEDNFNRISKELSDRVIIPVSSVYELALRRASKSGLIKYLPGDQAFEIVNRGKLSRKQSEVLDKILDFMKKYDGTGIQRCLNVAMFDVLRMIVVYPVEDASKYTDKNGNVLPDAYLVREGTTALDLAYLVHTDLGKGFLYAILAKEKKRIGGNYALKDGDIVKIVSTMARH